MAKTFILIFYIRAKYTVEEIPMRKRALRRDFISYIHFPYVVISKASHPFSPLVRPYVDKQWIDLFQPQKI